MGLFLDLLGVFVISMLLVTNRAAIRRFVLSLLATRAPGGDCGRARQMLVAGRYYLRAKVIVMAIVGALIYVALLLIDVPFAVPLAVVVASAS